MGISFPLRCSHKYRPSYREKLLQRKPAQCLRKLGAELVALGACLLGRLDPNYSGRRKTVPGCWLSAWPLCFRAQDGMSRQISLRAFLPWRRPRLQAGGLATLVGSKDVGGVYPGGTT